MNWHIVEGNWKRFKGRLRMSWGWVMDNPRTVGAGRRIELAGRQQSSYGAEKDEAARQLKRFDVHLKLRDAKKLS